MRTEVAIVGAGPAGSATAIALLRAGAESVMLLHRPDRRRPRVGESAAPDTRACLQRLGLGLALEQGHLPCLGTISQWGSAVPVGEDYALQGRGQGAHLDRARFDAGLRRAAVEAGARMLVVGELLALGREGSEWRLALRDPEGPGAVVVGARYVVDATGRRAVVARRTGARRRHVDRLLALAVRRPVARPSRLPLYSLVETTPEGWWYAGGVPGQHAVITFMTDPDIAREGGLLSGRRLSEELGRTHLIAPELSMVHDEAKPHVHCARTSYLDVVAGPGWLAVGDAAIGMDPLTSSGISCALADGLAAAEAIVGDRAGRRDALRSYASRIGGALRRYLGQRREMYGRERRWADAVFWGRRQSADGVT